MAYVSTSVIKLSNFPATLPNVPPNYPTGRAPGKIALLLNANDTYLYRRFSPYTNYHDSLLAPILSNKQPFVYTYIDEKDKGLINQLPDTVKNLVNVVGVNQDSVNDVVRVSKFLISSWGVQFLITQAAIQRLAPFDETRIYNPLSPILATVQPLTLGIGMMPTRHIEGGLLGLASSVTGVVGIDLQSGFQTPRSTAGNTALSTDNTGQGKGLIRGGGAGKGYARIQMKWPVSAPQPSTGGLGSAFSSGVASMVSAMGNAAGQMFGVTQVKQPSGTKVRADESTYQFMAMSYKLPKQAWYPNSKVTITGGAPISSSPLSKIVNQVTSAASAITSFIANPLGGLAGMASSLLGPSAGGSKSLQRIKLMPLPNGSFQEQKIDSGFYGKSIGGKVTGYAITDGDKYSSDVGRPLTLGEYTNSDMLVRYSYYLDKSNNYPTKQTDPTSETVKQINENLKAVLNSINATSIYNAKTTTISTLLQLPTDPRTMGYNRFNIARNNDPANRLGNQTLTSEYNDDILTPDTDRPRSIDSSVRRQGQNLRMATAFKSDGLNMLGILPKNRQFLPEGSLYAAYGSWQEWSPYDDDLIAFFFYDVVNEKYIPFRATVKAISEGNTAFWDELRFIGRADQLYSYNGFSRTLSFTFNVVISSVTELLPSWKKINYLASSVKPSNYTTGQNVLNQPFNRFIVPPMFMITIGDLYKFQPVVITSLNVNIPDDAAWETLNEDNSNSWNYLNGLITSPTLGKNYGQLPREVEIAVTCNLLEKERAIVGGSHFGHQPRVDDWEKKTNTEDRYLTDSTVPFLPIPTILHQKFVEWNQAGKPNPATPQTTAQKQSAAAAATTVTQPVTPLTFKLTSMPTTAGSVLSVPQFQVPSSLSNVNNVATPFNPGNPISSNVTIPGR